jgi:hypothetical protein
VTYESGVSGSSLQLVLDCDSGSSLPVIASLEGETYVDQLRMILGTPRFPECDGMSPSRVEVCLMH